MMGAARKVMYVVRLLTAVSLLAAFLPPRTARASGAMEFPDNGSEQEGRGGAWVARASDPLASLYNPAGLAGQDTRVTLQANLSAQHTCFTRTKANNDITSDGVAPGSGYSQVCQNGGLFPNPQLALTYRAADRVGLGVAVLGPSAVGNVTWPDFVGASPSPQRYLLVSSNVIMLTPAIAAGWEPVDTVRLGAAFIAGTAPVIDFINVSPALDSGQITPGNNDIRAEIKAKDYFIPGFVLSALVSPLDRLDIAAWYKYMAPVTAVGDAVTQAYFYQSPPNVVYGDTSIPNCNNPALDATKPCGSGNNARITIPLPMEAKIGVRYHEPRAVRETRAHRRDPLSEDVFDVEADLTWANDSAFDNLQIRFPGTAAGLGKIPANPGLLSAAVLPPNADVAHHFQDVFGVRIGGDYNVLPDQLAIRAGGFYESQAANPTYQNIDFDAASRFGLALGGTYRVRIGVHPVDVMLGYGHVFFTTLHNDNPGAQGLPALTGEQCPNGTPPAGTSCPQGSQLYRTPWAVNLGTITSSIDVINVGASFGF